MSSTSVTTSAALIEATQFLIRPLTLIHHSSTIDALRNALLPALAAVPTWRRNSRLTLTLSAGAPPRPVHIACTIAKIDWAEWFYALGSREFDITVNDTQVTVQVTGNRERFVVWKQEPAVPLRFMSTLSSNKQKLEIQVPISKLGQSIQSKWIRSCAPIIRPQPMTFAQRLLQSEHEKKEADEIFDIISNLNASLVSPAPTPKPLPIANAPCSRYARLAALEEGIFRPHSCLRQTIFAEDDTTPSPVSSPDSSRPSSPSSTFSFASSQESLTSISTTSSAGTSPTDIAPKSLTPPSKSNTFRSHRSRESTSTHIVVDRSKTQVQKYLYQGGQSTVLTGGVMLGAATKTSLPPTRSSTIPKYRIPARGRKASAF